MKTLLYILASAFLALTFSFGKSGNIAAEIICAMISIIDIITIASIYIVELLSNELKTRNNVYPKLDERLKKINFWNRLRSFVEDIQVSDQPSEEEKEMILNICNEFKNK